MPFSLMSFPHFQLDLLVSAAVEFGVRQEHLVGVVLVVSDLHQLQEVQNVVRVIQIPEQNYPQVRDFPSFYWLS